MRIGFDAKRAVANNTGLGNYSRYIIEILSEQFPDNEYLLYAPKRKDNPRLKAIMSRNNIRFVYPESRLHKLFSSLWRTRNIVSDLTKDNIDIFHGLSNEIPVGIRKTKIRSVVSIHDLIFLRYPHLYKPADRKIYRSKFLYACKNCDTVIAISECTKRDIISFFEIPADKIKVVYQGCDDSFSVKYLDEEKKKVKEKYDLPDRFLLNVGSIEERKNVLLAVKALRDTDPAIHLVAVGKYTPYVLTVKKYAEENGLEDRVRFLHDVSFIDLPKFYQLSELFLYPSFFEGFGIPIIEALNSEVPVIAATGSCLEEAGGPNSLYVDPNDAKALAENIRLVLNNADLRNTMIAAGKAYAEKFTPPPLAADLMQIYSDLLQ